MTQYSISYLQGSEPGTDRNCKKERVAAGLFAANCKATAMMTTAAASGRKAMLSQQFRQFMVKRN
jgi:hypothetical protein